MDLEGVDEMRRENIRVIPWFWKDRILSVNQSTFDLPIIPFFLAAKAVILDFHSSSQIARAPLTTFSRQLFYSGINGGI